MTLVEQVQKSLGVAVDGDAGAETWNAIYCRVVADVPPDGVACVATVFGLNYDGSPDRQDNGQGAFIDPKTGKNYDTTKVIGVSVPIPVLWPTIGGKKYSDVSNGVYTVTIYQPSTQRTFSNLAIVDLGPGEEVDGRNCLLVDDEGWGHYLDRTYALCQLMHSNDDEEIVFWVNDPKGPLAILGLDGPSILI